VPLAIVIIPFPAPCKSERRSTGAAEKHQTAAPIRCEAGASRADRTGWNERREAEFEEPRGDLRGSDQDAAVISPVFPG
jgi:hypothetical protein